MGPPPRGNGRDGEGLEPALQLEDTGHGPVDSESETQTHRLLRRGIPFGNTFGAAVGGGPADKRGLCFLAYQNDIEKHFEFACFNPEGRQVQEKLIEERLYND